MTARNDNPIRDRHDDTLGRAESAEAFASHVLALDRSEGAVVGVLGPWGSGKDVAEDSEDADLLALARKYRGGWRPKDFGADNDE